MYEFIPIAIGLVLGPSLLKLRSSEHRIAVGAAACLTVGVAVALIAGELEKSPLFALWDAAQCAIVAVLAGSVIRLRQHRT